MLSARNDNIVSSFLISVLLFFLYIYIKQKTQHKLTVLAKCLV